jgi:hypothetical protein
MLLLTHLDLLLLLLLLLLHASSAPSNLLTLASSSSFPHSNLACKQTKCFGASFFY